ncbi:hypothetical protein [Alteromonas ponticola]|uniref:Uncharacterized protein n=1 Tax=Alteromonas ponticola TaxID=2720613 RepID=A0ABX1R3J7_9ALTE|nr:hypothetical protein [Alteromonas ponticola]NMH61004.1 hypothetical protein [Alteromonas ponticola]
MEDMHIERIKRSTDEKYLHKIINLEIEDKFAYFDDTLIKLLESRVALP